MIAFKLYCLYLSVAAVFVVVILRACYFTFVVKCDPIKTFSPPTEGLWKIFNKQRKDRENRIKRSTS